MEKLVLEVEASGVGTLGCGADGVRFRHLLSVRRQSLPWVAIILVGTCILATAPMFFNEELYGVLGADAAELRWWHAVVTQFVHGGGAPGKVAHLVGNSAIILVYGSLVERAVGHSRFLALSAICGLTTWLVFQHGLGLRFNGASGMAWGYSVFAIAVAAHMVRASPRAVVRDPVAWLLLSVAGLMAVGSLILAAQTVATMARGESPASYSQLPHALCVLTSAALLVVWRRNIPATVRSARLNTHTNKDCAESANAARVAIVLTLGLLVFVSTVVLLALSGRLR